MLRPAHGPGSFDGAVHRRRRIHWKATLPTGSWQRGHQVVDDLSTGFEEHVLVGGSPSVGASRILASSNETELWREA